MAKETDTTRLEARIVELENALKALAALRRPVDLSADEIKAYLKVRDALVCDFNCGNQPCGPCAACGVYSRCTPTACWVCGVCGLYACYPCHKCNIGDFGGGGLPRFTDLGS